MCRLIESIRIENRQLHHIELHNARFNVAREKLFGLTNPIKLEDIINIPSTIGEERYKCRVITDGKNIEYEIILYTQRIIKSLKVVYNDHIDYSIKFEDRSSINSLFKIRGKCDDILIIKHNNITDSSAANILLYDGSEWLTPTTPLLNGVQRRFLLNQGIIKEKKITISDLLNFQKIKLVNAMIDFERAPLIDVNSCVCFDSTQT
ncbi:MAG: aminotransferase class IV [Prolixibacteraceae bacterium]|nr:aminotransferase class IV [Prolixibacteraceae bacterium]